ncbi:MAG: GNAT family N-acetyltransferase [Anaerolineaceae bacterium]|nr:GNAT family N-acetyltransferase [Anaerolineaceae bacterium]
MHIQECDYTHSEAEFDAMRELMVRSYLVNRRPFNWRLAMAENWNYASLYLEPIEYFIERVHLWRGKDEALAGFLIHDYDMTCPQVDYQHRDLEDEMFAWTEAHWGGEKSEINTMVYDWDVERQDLLQKRGYENKGAIEDVRIYDLNLNYPEVELPPGFRFGSMAEGIQAAERVALENSVWNATLTDDWLRGKQSAPSYSPAWDLLAISPEGKLAAANLVWLYPRNRSAEIDPLGTHPDFRKLGLARALVLESFKRMNTSGIELAYIASYTQNPVVSKFYASLDPVELIQGYHWVKKVA